VKLLHFADLHLDKAFVWATLEQARKRRAALRQTLLHICQLADDLKVDGLTCGGDLYEQERFTPDTAEFLRSSFAELDPLPVFLAPGNHDWFGNSSLYRRVQWSPNVHIFKTAELTAFPFAEGLTFWGAAHVAKGSTRGFLDAFHVDRGGVHLALFHGSAQESLPIQWQGGMTKEPYAPFREEQISKAGLHHALLGHFHHPNLDAPHYTYPGNPDPLAFGETWQGAAVLLTVGEAGAVIREPVPVATSVVCDVSVDLTGATHAEQACEKVLDAVANLSGFVRVTLYGELGPDVDARLQDIAALHPPHLDAFVVRRGPVTYRYDYELLKDEQTVRGQFVRDVLADTSLTDDKRSRILETGLRALCDRDTELDVL